MTHTQSTTDWRAVSSIIPIMMRSPRRVLWRASPPWGSCRPAHRRLRLGVLDVDLGAGCGPSCRRLSRCLGPGWTRGECDLVWCVGYSQANASPCRKIRVFLLRPPALPVKCDFSRSSNEAERSHYPWNRLSPVPPHADQSLPSPGDLELGRGLRAKVCPSAILTSNQIGYRTLKATRPRLRCSSGSPERSPTPA
jgi:hypothetical protein